MEELPPRWAYAWRLTKAILREMRRRVKAENARFVVAIVPSKLSVRSVRRNWNDGRESVPLDLTRPDTRSEEFLASAGIPTCPLLPAFQEHFRATGMTGFHGWDIHWSPEGHAIVAAELASCLERLGLVPLRGRAARSSFDDPAPSSHRTAGKANFGSGLGLLGRRKLAGSALPSKRISSVDSSSFEIASFQVDPSDPRIVTVSPSRLQSPTTSGRSCSQDRKTCRPSSTAKAICSNSVSPVT
jgi:hypothetical protein